MTDTPQPVSISVRTDPADGLVTITLSGELDMATTADVEQQALAAIAGASAVIVDLSEVSFMDSTGIGLLVRLRNTVHDIRVINTRAPVDRVLRATGLDEVFHLPSNG